MDSKQLALEIRKQAIEMTHRSHASHIGAVLSVADIIAVLYHDTLNVDSENPEDDHRDRLILSKGHAGIAVYAALAERGFFDKQLLNTYYQNGSILSGHISHKGVPGVEVSTGSLGHGIGIAVGMALAAKIDEKAHHIYVIVGDGECEEGSIWEAALFATHHCLNNLTVIVDHNKMQAMGTCEEQLGWKNLAGKWEAFGFQVLECNGHNHGELREILKVHTEGKPMCILAHTVKGKGISFMENNLLWHYRDPQGEFYTRAKYELEEQG
ncbi:transketolase [Lachnospiraceae bacterium 54-11]